MAGELGFWGREVRASRPRGLWENSQVRTGPTCSHFLGTCSVPACEELTPVSLLPSLPLQLLPLGLHFPICKMGGSAGPAEDFCQQREPWGSGSEDSARAWRAPHLSGVPAPHLQSEQVALRGQG